MNGAALRALVRLASIVTDSRAAPELLEAVAETARELLAAESLSISEVSVDRAHLRTVINVGQLGAGEQRWPVNETYPIANFPDTLGFLVNRPVRRLATCVDDPHAEPAEAELLRSLGKYSSLKTPILVDGRMWGELWAARTARTAPFAEYDGDLAEVIVGLVSAGLAQAHAWQRMRELALTDPMTGMANRRAFDEHLNRFLARTHQTGRTLALAVGDVNGLKRVNDTQGHAAGDDALLHVASAATTAIAGVPNALAGRLGGDEFALILPGLDRDAAMAAAARWCTLAAHPEYGISLACGLAITTPDGAIIDPRDLLRAADTAQYDAKRRGSAVPVPAWS